MNNQRRKAIEKLIIEINAVALDNQKVQLLDAKEALEQLRDEEQEYLDNMPENLHGSDKYSDSEQSIQSMDEAMQLIESVTDAIEEFQNSFSLEVN